MKFIKLYSALFLVFATLVLGAGNADAKGDDFEMTNLDVGAEILYQDIKKREFMLNGDWQFGNLMKLNTEKEMYFWAAFSSLTNSYVSIIAVVNTRGYVEQVDICNYDLNTDVKDLGRVFEAVASGIGLSDDELSYLYKNSEMMRDMRSRAGVVWCKNLNKSIALLGKRLLDGRLEFILQPVIVH